jgi:hypothetical protein
MTTASHPTIDKRSVLMDHLRSQGFTVGKTERGFIAVDDDGVIFTCSPGRTHVCVVHSQNDQYMEHRCNGLPDPEWFDDMTNEMVQFSKGKR